jgi:nicotinamide-nucleotide amidase
MKEITASVITIGDELLIGQTIDTNSAFIGTELNKCGIWLKRRIAVGDDKHEILKALVNESKDTDIVIITGGLGPTADDITKPVLCDYFNAKLVVNEEALENVKAIFQKINRPVQEVNLRQAEVPENCKVLPNKRGTAPGMWFKKGNVIYVSLPGVPHEMKGLMMDSVLPLLKQTFSLPHIEHRTLLLAGKGESEVAEIIREFENALPSHIKLAYLPAYSLVRLRLTAKGESNVAEEVDEQFARLKPLVKEWLVADTDISLVEAVSKLLRTKKKTVATAESCTGGYISHLITSLPGSSDIYPGSIISYANAVKQDLLGVNQETIKTHGAVSEETVREMAAGLLKTIDADYAIAVSGIMGPGGGWSDKPAGTVWIAVADRNTMEATKFFFRFNRERNIELTANTALNMLRRFIIREDSNSIAAGS